MSQNVFFHSPYATYKNLNYVDELINNVKRYVSFLIFAERGIRLRVC